MPGNGGKTNLEEYLEEKARRQTKSVDYWVNRRSNTRLRHVERSADLAINRFRTAKLPSYQTKPVEKPPLPPPILKYSKNSEEWLESKVADEFTITGLTYFRCLKVGRRIPVVNSINVALRSTKRIPGITTLITTAKAVVEEKPSEQVSIVQLEVKIHPVDKRSRFTSVSSTIFGGDDDCWEYIPESEKTGESEDYDWEYEEYDIQDYLPSLPNKSLQNPFSKTKISFEYPNETLESSRKLETFLNYLKNKDNDVLFVLQEHYGTRHKSKKKGSELKPSIIKSTGGKDKQGRLNGEGEVWFSNGSKFTGHLKHGSREGFGVLELKNGDIIEGMYKRDKLDGWCIHIYDEYGWKQKHFSDGMESGFYRDLAPGGQSIKFGLIGHKQIWKFIEGGAAMFGSTNNEGQFNGDVVYLYPGFRLGITGQFVNGRLKSGTEAINVQLKSDEFGMPVPEMMKLRNSRTLSHESPGAHSPAQNLHLRDLVDILNVYVDQSNVPMAGQGLFAKQFIEKGDVVVIFNGARKRRHLRPGQTVEEFSDYCIRVDESLSLDIPAAYVPVDKYSTTLAHKACHSFKANSIFCNLEHPRFGRIMCIKALVNIAEGEEVLVSYNYRMEGAPEWYSNHWFDHLRQIGWPEEFVEKYGLPAAGCSAIFHTVNNKVKHCTS